MGEQDGGFLAAEISPCGELIVFITKLNTIIMFDKEMNIVDEKALEEGKEGDCSELGISDAVVKWRHDSNVGFSTVLFDF
jgi:hypothetical protein